MIKKKKKKSKPIPETSCKHEWVTFKGPGRTLKNGEWKRCEGDVSLCISCLTLDYISFQVLEDQSSGHRAGLGEHLKITRGWALKEPPYAPEPELTNNFRFVVGEDGMTLTLEQKVIIRKRLFDWGPITPHEEWRQIQKVGSDGKPTT